MRQFDGFEVSCAPKTGPLAHDMNCEREEGFEDPVHVGAYPVLGPPDTSKPACWAIRENGSASSGE